MIEIGLRIPDPPRALKDIPTAFDDALGDEGRGGGQAGEQSGLGGMDRKYRGRRKDGKHIGEVRLRSVTRGVDLVVLNGKVVKPIQANSVSNGHLLIERHRGGVDHMSA